MMDSSSCDLQKHKNDAQAFPIGNCSSAKFYFVVKLFVKSRQVVQEVFVLVTFTRDHLATEFFLWLLDLTGLLAPAFKPVLLVKEQRRIVFHKL